MVKSLLVSTALVALVASAAAQPLPAYDLLLRGGHVIDAKNHIDVEFSPCFKIIDDRR